MRARAPPDERRLPEEERALGREERGRDELEALGRDEPERWRVTLLRPEDRPRELGLETVDLEGVDLRVTLLRPADDLPLELGRATVGRDGLERRTALLPDLCEPPEGLLTTLRLEEPRLVGRE